MRGWDEVIDTKYIDTPIQIGAWHTGILSILLNSMNIIHFIKLFFLIVAFLMKAHALGDLELEQRAGPEPDLFSFLP